MRGSKCLRSWFNANGSVIEEKVPETEGAALRVSEPNHGFDNVPKLSCASEGAAICAKKLPLDATIAFVENAFKQFGEIRRGGVEVRINWVKCYSTNNLFYFLNTFFFMETLICLLV